ncbi:MAG: BatD family protein [Gammaproteobacteria bacterium]|nr:BatD family protein [Gammaproteobacteria bacterium]
MKCQHRNFPDLILSVLIVSLLFWCVPLAAEVEVKLSRNTTSLEEPVRLQIQIKGDNPASPDLSVLQDDFEIIGRATQQNISIINGQMTKTQGLNLTLLPKRTGRLTIPPIPVGTELSTPLTLEVGEVSYEVDENTAARAFIRLELSKHQAYLQEEVILTLRLYQADGVRGESLSEPQASLDDTLLHLLHEEQYQAEHEGQSYRVVERRYAVYAYQTGKMQLGDVRYRGRSGSNSASIFDLMRDPFGNPPQESRIIRTQSEQLELEVLPVPAQFTGERWLPARNLQIIERDIESNGPIQAGKPASRHIMMFADGLSAAQLPAIEMELPAGLKQYPQRPQAKDNLSRDGISGSRQTSVTLVATEAGSYYLPAIEIPWWNTETNRQELARLPAVTLEIMPGLGASTPYVPPPTSASKKLDDLHPQPALDEPAEVAASGEDGNRLAVWLVWGLGIGWLATLAGWWMSHRRKKPEAVVVAKAAVEEQPQDQLPEIIEALETAYQATDQEAARRAWLRWGQYHWADNPPSNLNRLAKRCNHNIALAINILDRTFYSPENPDDWRQFSPRELLESDNVTQTRPVRRENLIPLNP